MISATSIKDRLKNQAVSSGLHLRVEYSYMHSLEADLQERQVT